MTPTWPSSTFGSTAWTPTCPNYACLPYVTLSRENNLRLTIDNVQVKIVNKQLKNISCRIEILHSKLYYSRIKTFENSNNNINFVLAGEDDATEVIPDEDDQGERMECRCGVTNCRKILFL